MIEQITRQEPRAAAAEPTPSEPVSNPLRERDGEWKLSFGIPFTEGLVVGVRRYRHTIYGDLLPHRVRHAEKIWHTYVAFRRKHHSSSDINRVEIGDSSGTGFSRLIAAFYGINKVHERFKK